MLAVTSDRDAALPLPKSKSDFIADSERGISQERVGIGLRRLVAVGTALAGGAKKGAAFVSGWLVSLALVVTVTVLATGNNSPKPDTAPSRAALAVRIVVGVILVAVAIRQRWRMRRPKKPKKAPK